MNSLTETFNYENQVVRTAGTPDQPLFCVQDICSVLGVKNHRNKVALLDSDEKDAVQSMDAIGRRQNQMFCTEPGLYRIIFSVQKNEITEPFKRWVFHEVLPSIRKTGKYQADAAVRQVKFEAKKLDLEFCKMAADMFPECTRMKYLLKEKLASTLSCGDQLALPALMLLTVSEILEQKGFARNKVTKHRSKFGRKVANDWRKHNYCEPQKVQKLINGHDCRVNSYPESYFQRIVDMWLAFIAPPMIRSNPWDAHRVRQRDEYPGGCRPIEHRDYKI